jgi:hypothetical protein
MTLLVPLLVTVLIAVITSIKVSSRTTGKFETCITEIQKRLDRIETKVDNFILKNLE